MILSALVELKRALRNAAAMAYANGLLVACMPARNRIVFPGIDIAHIMTRRRAVRARLQSDRDLLGPFRTA